MKRAIKYNPTNQNSLFAGFTPKLSFSMGKNPFTNTEKSLPIEYQCFLIKWINLIIHQKRILLNKETFLLNQKSFLLNKETFLLNREIFPLNQKSFRLNRETFRLNQKSFRLNRETFLLNEETFPLNDHLNLLRNKSFRSGNKAFIFVRNLSLKRTSLSQSTKDHSPNGRML